MNAGAGKARYGESTPKPRLGQGRAGFVEEECVHGDLKEEKRPEQQEQRLHVPGVRERSLLSENCPPLFFLGFEEECDWEQMMSVKQGPESFVNCKGLESAESWCHGKVLRREVIWHFYRLV